MISEQIERLTNIRDAIKSKCGVSYDARIDELAYFAADKNNWGFTFYLTDGDREYYPSFEGYSIDVRKSGEMLSFSLVASHAWEVDTDASQLYGAHIYSYNGSGSTDFKVDLPTVDSNTEYLIVLRSCGCPLNLRINQIK